MLYYRFQRRSKDTACHTISIDEQKAGELVEIVFDTFAILTTTFESISEKFTKSKYF